MKKLFLPLVLILALLAACSGGGQAEETSAAGSSGTTLPETTLPETTSGTSASTPALPVTDGEHWSLSVPVSFESPMQPYDPERQIYGVEFDILFGEDGVTVEPLMGEYEKLLRVDLTESSLTVTLDGDYDFIYENIPASAEIWLRCAGESCYIGPDLCTASFADALSRDENGEHRVTLSFSNEYIYTLIERIHFTFGKVD